MNKLIKLKIKADVDWTLIGFYSVEYNINP